MTGTGRGKQETLARKLHDFEKIPVLPFPSHFHLVFCRSRSNFCAVTRLETVATQAKRNLALTVIFESNDMRK